MADGDGLRQRPGDQPLPIPNDSPLIHDLVAADLEAPKQLGISRYGQALQAGNGRNALLDAYEEMLDQAVYLKQRLVEEEAELMLGLSPQTRALIEREAEKRGMEPGHLVAVAVDEFLGLQ